VGTWEDVALSSEMEQARREEARASVQRKRGRRYDAYEMEYDRGRLKKPLRQALAKAEAEAEAKKDKYGKRKPGKPGKGKGGGKGW